MPRSAAPKPLAGCTVGSMKWGIFTKAWGLVAPVALGAGLVTAPVTGLVAAPGAGASTSHADRPAQSLPDGGRYLEPVFDGMDVTRDVPYREAVDVNGEDVTLHLDIYEPAGDTAAERPVVMYIHGGFFAFGSKADTFGAEQAITSLGYVFVSVQYRLHPDAPSNRDELIAGIYDAYDDSLAAVEWLRDNAEEYRLDPDAIVPIGVSAGAITAWNLAWMPGSDERPDATGVPAAVSISGSPYRRSPTGDLVAAADRGEPPVLAFHGTADAVVPYSGAEGSCREAARVGVYCELVSYEGGGHEVGLSKIDDIQRRTRNFLAEHVLAPLGYFGDQPPPTSSPPTTAPPGTTQPPGSGPTTAPPSTTPPSDGDPGGPDGSNGTPEPVASPPAAPVPATPTFTG